MWETSQAIIAAYGFPAFLGLIALLIIAWIARVALKNPLDVVSGALQDVNAARVALREEVKRRDDRIAELEKKIKELEQDIDILQGAGNGKTNS